MNLADGLNNSFRSSLDSMHENLLWQTSRINTIKKYMLGMILRMIVMISIWIVVISGMTTTSIFYLMTLLHLL
jgi:hypothetical protein